MDRVQVEFRPSQLPAFVASDLLDDLRAVGVDAEMAPAMEVYGYLSTPSPGGGSSMPFVLS